MLPHPCILGDAKTKGDKITGGYLTLAFSGGPKEGGNATSPLHSRGLPNKAFLPSVGAPQKARVR